MSKKTFKILITSAGSVNAVNVIKALKKQNDIRISITSVDADCLSPGFYLSDSYYTVPKVDQINFIPKILEICQKEKIEIILPINSIELPIFSKNKKLIKRAGIKMAVSNPKVYEFTEDKIKTHNFFKKNRIFCPKLYSLKELESGTIEFPLIIKPRRSSGSKNVYQVNNKRELQFFVKYVENPIIEEFVKGKEYTIDTVSDLSGKMIAASPRIRIQVRDGIAVKSITKSNQLLVDYAMQITNKLEMVGPGNIQCIINDKDIKFIEVNNRFPAGGLPLTVEAGLNIPLIIIKLLLGRKIGKINIKSGITMIRYWDSLFLNL